MNRAKWTPERWRQIQELLDQALAHDPESQKTFLERCRRDDSLTGDDELLRDVEAFLAQETEISDFIEKSCLVVRHPESGEDPETGRRLGPYRFVCRRGQGGMGDVYLAVREDDYRARVAVKLVRPEQASEEVSRRFLHERQILAQLEHPYIARLLDGGTAEDGRPYFVMEYVEGQRIDHYCDGQRLPVRERLELFGKVCEAVDLAHRNLVIHRDLKPSNILVNEAGDPKLLDFGIAKVIGAGAPAELTREHAPMTYKYASPEQVLGDAITTASDVYSLGLVLHQLLTGRLPGELAFKPSSSLQAISGDLPARPSQVVTGRARSGGGLDPEHLSELRRSTPGKLRRQLAGDLDAIVLKALRREPGERYDSVGDLADDVRRHLVGRPVRARRDSFGYHAGKFVRRRKVELAAVAVLLVLGLGLARTALEAAGERQKVEAVVGFLEEVVQLPDPRRRADPETILAEAKEKIAGSLGEEPDLQARVMDSLGLTYGALGFPEAAELLITEALAIRRRIHGNDHPLVAESMANLGYTLRLRDDVERAEPLLRDALALFRQHFGNRDDPLLAHTITNYAGLMKDLGNYAEAERHYRESLEMRSRLYGPGHREVARGLGNLGALLEDRGRYDEAETYFRRALEIRRTELLPGDSELVQSEQHMARLLYHREAYAEAAELFQEVVAKRRQIYGKRHLEVAKGLNNLAACLHRQGQLEEAEPLFREALAVRLEKLDGGHHDVAVVRRNLAALLLDQGQSAEAEPLARQALAGFLASRPPTYWRHADARSVLGACLTALGRFEEAEPFLVKGHQALLEDKGPSSIYTRDAKLRLAYYRSRVSNARP